LRRGTGRGRALSAALALLLGALILWLAVPRLVAAALLALREPVIRQMDAAEPVPAADLFGLIASRELALGWVQARESHDERATALARLAFAEAPGSAAQRATLERAVDALRQGLALAPADPADWLQLAYLLVLLDGDTSREAARALLLSIRTGPYQAPDLLQRRLFWSLAHWQHYDPAERRQVGDQVRLAWQAIPGELAELALDLPEFVTPIVSALARDPAARDRFVAAIALASPLAID
jgi:hypothetical protein